nr:hypothetical protein Itr_chr10CG12150 [Ipomoea trifida]GMD48399.1 hypothetical protein Iba_chr10fCG6010 [Ipomoea batatas]
MCTQKINSMKMTCDRSQMTPIGGVIVMVLMKLSGLYMGTGALISVS